MCSSSHLFIAGSLRCSRWLPWAVSLLQRASSLRLCAGPSMKARCDKEVNMHQIGVLIVRVFAPALGVLLGLLGFATLGENILGWLLFVAGVAYAAGTIIAGYMLRKATWDPHASGVPSQAEASDPSFWLL